MGRYVIGAAVAAAVIVGAVLAYRRWAVLRRQFPARNYRDYHVVEVSPVPGDPQALSVGFSVYYSQVSRNYWQRVVERLMGQGRN